MRYDTVEVTKLRGMIVTIQNERDSAIKARDAMAEKLGRAREALKSVQFEDDQTGELTSYVRDIVEKALAATEPDKPAAPAERPCHCEAIKADDEAPGCYSNCPNYKPAPAPSKEKPK